MAHTNSTPNYNLPQFLPTDKPAWLVDVNPAYASIDTAIKNASDAAGNAQEDATQALSDAAGAQATATQANTKADGAIASLAENFLDTATYAVGEYVIFNNILYVCTEPVTTPGPWTGSVNWTRASVDSIATSINNDINDLKSRTGSDIPISDSSTTSITEAIKNPTAEIGLFTPANDIVIVRSVLLKVNSIKFLTLIFNVRSSSTTIGTLSEGFEALHNYDLTIANDNGTATRARIQNNTLSFSLEPVQGSYYALTIAFI